MSEIKKSVELLARAQYQKPLECLTPHQLHSAVAGAVMAHIAPAWENSRKQHASGRRAYYLSAEFLVGRAIYNNLICSGLYTEMAQLLQKSGADIGAMEAVEDAALGNGGLGRLAACFLDSAATLKLPLDGYGIRYRYGLFSQRFENGFQTETADDWSRHGDPWSVRREDETVTVNFADGDVLAVPYDMPVIGYGGKHIGTIRLWQCEPIQPFDFDKFNQCKYSDALAQRNRAEDISRVLYPNDSTPNGKLLRLKQQYFFTSASLKDMLRSFKQNHGDDYSRLPQYVCVQLNDTHPVIAIPELIRLMMSDGVAFDNALSIAKGVFNYTNHTVMQEALETWEMRTVQRVSPEIARIILRINTRLKSELRRKKIGEDKWPQLVIVQKNRVHMAYLACYCSSHINGVAELHTEIIKSSVLSQWYALYPDRFQNKTNGITQRRWLLLCNQGLSSLITELLGSSRWVTDLKSLKKLAVYADDKDVLDKFMAIKRQNKQLLAKYIGAHDGKLLDPDTIVDAQIKRLHEYKRQLLNILAILELYFEIKDGTLTDFVPTTFIFGAKAAPGYAQAKGIIKLINEISRLIDADADANRCLKIIFVSDYNVSYAEKIVAAADVSEQISTAGTEASGTGNMKLMLNGAVTLGTYDGANIEIVREAGDENNYILGARVEEIEALRGTYNPRKYYESDSRIKRCLDALIDGTLDDGGTGMFAELYHSLLDRSDYSRADNYCLLLDFDSFLKTKKRINNDYRDRYAFAKKQWLNMCSAGKFSSDRTVSEYAEDIWHIKKCK